MWIIAPLRTDDWTCGIQSVDNSMKTAHAHGWLMACNLVRCCCPRGDDSPVETLTQVSGMTWAEGVTPEASLAMEVISQGSGNNSCAAAGCSGAAASLWTDLDGTLFGEPSQVSCLLFGVLKVFALSPSACTLQHFLVSMYVSPLYS